MGRDFQEGMRKLSRKLSVTLPKAARDAAVRATRQGAEELVAMQKRNAPVDDGDLQMSITYTEPYGTTPPYSQPGGSRRARPEEFIVTAGNSKVRYPHLVEFGTAPHTAGGFLEGAQHPGTAAQPFFWTSYRALKGRITRRTNKAIKEAIAREARG